MMYSENNKISLRQTYRLFTFDFLGIGALVLVPYLAKNAGVYALICILIGGVLSLLFLRWLSRVMKKMKRNLPDFLQTQTRLPKMLRKVIFGFLGWSNAMMAGFVAFVLSTLIRTCLVEDENYLLILLLLLLVAGYAVSGGLESRARIYELLFYLLLFPLLAMLVMSIPKIHTSYLMFQKTWSLPGIVRGCYMVFLTFMSSFFVLYLPGKVTSGEKEATADEICRTAGKALVTAVGILLFSYFILLGTMGEAAICHIEYPIVTLMSTMVLPGGFVTRLDAIMMAVWFFTIFALLNMNLHYGSHMLKLAVGKDGQLRYLVLTLLRAALAATFLYYANGTREQVIVVFWCVVTPVNLCLSIVLWFLGRGEERICK